MQVWNVLHAARCKYRTQKWCKKSPSGHHRATLSGYIFATEACINNRKKKLVKQQYLPHMSLQYGELRPTSAWDRFVSLGDPSKFQRVSRLRSVTARHSSSGRQPNFAVLNRGRHLCSAGRPSRWALAHILVYSSIAARFMRVVTRQVKPNVLQCLWTASWRVTSLLKQLLVAYGHVVWQVRCYWWSLPWRR